MESVNKILNFFYADYTQSQAVEVDYLLFKYKAKDDYEKKMIDKASDNMISYSIAGACVGLSLALSLRRYMPDTFADISFKRCIVDVFLTLSGYSICSNLGMELALENLVEIRKNLIMTIKDNSEYVDLMRKKYYDYPKVFGDSKKFWLEIFSEEEYKEMQEKNNKFFVDFYNPELVRLTRNI